MYTDPGHVRASDPGTVEGNVVFAYLDAFDADREAVAELKSQYRRGGLGDMALKQRLEGVLEEHIAPIRERRATLTADLGQVLDIVRDGTHRARRVTRSVLSDVREAFSLDFML
jgi:tryptophanyl-tRNA synthetase